MAQDDYDNANINEHIRMVKTRFKGADTEFFDKPNEHDDSSHTSRNARHDRADDAVTRKPGMPRKISKTREQQQRSNSLSNLFTSSGTLLDGNLKFQLDRDCPALKLGGANKNLGDPVLMLNKLVLGRYYRLACYVIGRLTGHPIKYPQTGISQVHFRGMVTPSFESTMLMSLVTSLTYVHSAKGKRDTGIPRRQVLSYMYLERISEAREVEASNTLMPFVPVGGTSENQEHSRAQQRQRARESQRNAIRQARSGEASPAAE
jgi:hypothetical protein